MVSLLDDEIRTLNLWTLCDYMEPIDAERDRTGLSRIDVQMLELVDNRRLKLGGSPVSYSPFQRFVL